MLKADRRSFAQRRDAQLSGAVGRFPAFQLQQVPSIAPKIFEDGDPSIRLVARRLKKTYALGLKPRMIAGKVVAMKEEKDPSAGLIANPLGLAFIARLGEKKTNAAAG